MGRSGEVAVICGGVGAARFLSGLLEVVEASQVTAIVNVGDDTELHGLSVSPDLDTITYTLGGAADLERGWGLRGETWAAMEQLERYGGDAWFRLGDRDLATHLYRSDRLAAGATLAEVSAELARAFGLEIALLPVTNDRLRTRLELVEGGEVAFQEYFVRLCHEVAVSSVRFEGADTARPAPGVLEAIEHAEAVVVAPSNPIVSIGPVLAVPGVEEALARRREAVVAVSPIVAGKALKGPADRLLSELIGEASVAAVARVLAPVIGTLVIDAADAADAAAVEETGVACKVTDTVMSRPGVGAALAAAVLEEATRGR